MAVTHGCLHTSVPRCCLFQLKAIFLGIGPRLTNDGLRSWQLLMDVSIPESIVKFGTSNIRELTKAKLGETKAEEKSKYFN
jgi:hypothetical protein